jgi:transcriptional regulator with XRE-family HTH domain
MNTDPKDRWHDLGAFIREQRGSARLSLRRLSELAGISNPYLSQIERGLRRPSAEILQQIAKALAISAETLYVQAGILEPPDGTPDLTRVIMADQAISEDQKQALVRIYLSFRREFEDEQAQAAARATTQATAAAAGHAASDSHEGDGGSGGQPPETDDAPVAAAAPSTATTA